MPACGILDPDEEARRAVDRRGCGNAGQQADRRYEHVFHDFSLPRSALALN